MHKRKDLSEHEKVKIVSLSLMIRSYLISPTFVITQKISDDGYEVLLSLNYSSATASFVHFSDSEKYSVNVTMKHSQTITLIP